MAVATDAQEVVLLVAEPKTRYNQRQFKRDAAAMLKPSGGVSKPQWRSTVSDHTPKQESTDHEKAQKAADFFFGWWGKRPRPHRKKTTIEQRLTPCEWCKYPISQRHHIFAVHRYGENSLTVQLCANCHELFHIVYDVRVKNSQSAARKLLKFIQAFGESDKALSTAAWHVEVVWHHEHGDFDEWSKLILGKASADE